MKGVIASGALVLLVSACTHTPAQTPPAGAESTPTSQIALPADLCDLFPQTKVESVTEEILKQSEATSDRCSYRSADDPYWPYQLDIDAYSIESICDSVGGADVKGIGERACMSTSTLFDSSALTFSYGGRSFDISVQGDQDGTLKKALAKIVLSQLKAR